MARMNVDNLCDTEDFRDVARTAFRLRPQGDFSAPASDSLSVYSQVSWINQQRPRYADFSWPDDLPVKDHPQSTLADAK